MIGTCKGVKWFGEDGFLTAANRPTVPARILVEEVDAIAWFKRWAA